MANRQQRRTAQKNGAGGFLEQLAEAGKRAQEHRAAQAEDDELDEDGELTGPSGALPLPVCQEVYPNRFVWYWEPIPDEVHVKTTYFKNGDPDWVVEMTVADKITTYDTEQARMIAEALLAAHNWQNVWKMHMADYMLNPGKEPEPVGSQSIQKWDVEPNRIVEMPEPVTDSTCICPEEAYNPNCPEHGRDSLITDTNE